MNEQEVSRVGISQHTVPTSCVANRGAESLLRSSMVRGPARTRAPKGRVHLGLESNATTQTLCGFGNEELSHSSRVPTSASQKGGRRIRGFAMPASTACHRHGKDPGGGWRGRFETCLPCFEVGVETYASECHGTMPSWARNPLGACQGCDRLSGAWKARSTSKPEVDTVSASPGVRASGVASWAIPVDVQDSPMSHTATALECSNPFAFQRRQ